MRDNSNSADRGSTDSGTGAPLVSIILATRNGSATLVDAVDSILGQSYRELELVVVDDASTDATQDVLAQYANDDRLRILRNEERRGLARGLNRAIRHSQGEFVARMDDDDRSLPDRIARQVKFLLEHPEVDVLGTGAQLFDSETANIRTIRMPETDAAIKSAICKFCPFIHPSVMFRRRFLERTGGYDERLNRKEDYELWGRAAKFACYHNLQEPLLEYRVKGKKALSAVPSGIAVRIKNGWRMRCLGRSLFWGVAYSLVSVLRHVGYVQKSHRKAL